MNRTFIFMICVALGLLLSVSVSNASGSAPRAGIKLWYAEPKVVDRAMMYGAAGRMHFMDDYWVSAHYMRGDFDFIERVRPRSVKRVAQQDAEIVAGRNFNIFNAGIGFRLSTVLREGDPVGDLDRVMDDESYGPMVSLGAVQSFEDWPWGFRGSPWGWYAGVSAMVNDFSDHDGEHLTVMAGLSHYSHNMHKTIGYRFQNFFDHEQVEGFTAGLLFEF